MRFNPDNYVDVQERINRFWVEYPEGNIITELMSPPADFSKCRYKAEVYKDKNNARPDATGFAFEIAGGNGANSTSHEENCETSAIGRALANMGYATTRDDRPSRQEMTKVSNHQPAPENAPQATTARQNGIPGHAPVGVDQDGDVYTEADMRQQRQTNRPTINNPGEPASEKQVKAIWAIAGGIGMDYAELHEFAGVQTFDGLTKGAASDIIDRLNKLRGNG